MDLHREKSENNLQKTAASGTSAQLYAGINTFPGRSRPAEWHKGMSSRFLIEKRALPQNTPGRVPQAHWSDLPVNRGIGFYGYH
jgi:hypothetical protein